MTSIVMRVCSAISAQQHNEESRDVVHHPAGLDPPWTDFSPGSLSLGRLIEAAPGLMPLLFESRRMSTMPKKIDEELKARAVRLVNDHQGEYSSLTAAAGGRGQAARCGQGIRASLGDLVPGRRRPACRGEQRGAG